MTDEFPYVFDLPYNVLKLDVMSKIEPPDQYNPFKTFGEIQELMKQDLTQDEYIIVKKALAESMTLCALIDLGGGYTIVNDFEIELKEPFIDHNWDIEIESVHVDHIVLGYTTVFVLGSIYLCEPTGLSEYQFGPVEEIQLKGKAVWGLLKRRHSFMGKYQTLCSSCGPYTPPNVKIGAPIVTVKTSKEIATTLARRDMLGYREEAPPRIVDHRRIVNKLFGFYRTDWWRPGDGPKPLQ